MACTSPVKRNCVKYSTNAALNRVPDRVQHAIVGRQPADEEALHTGLAQMLVQSRPLEHRVGLLLGVSRFGDDDCGRWEVEVAMELGPLHAHHAVDGPDAALLAKRTVHGGMPVARGENR